ncbi:MAG: cation diffusion facilitator family transporter [Spirochaetales bacterium]
MSEHQAVTKANRGLKTTLLGILINLVLALTKGIAGFLGNSFALIADAIESSSDIFSSIAVYIGLKFSSIPKDENHPYGHGKAEPIAALVVTLALFGAALLIIVNSLQEIVKPHHAPEPFTLIVLVGVVITKELLFRFVSKVGKEVGSTAVKTDAWHHRSDALTSAAAFVGISVALLGGAGWESADDWAALVASAIIILNAVLLFVPAFNEIMDAKPAGDYDDKVRALALSVPGVADTDKCHVRKMGLEFVVDLQIRVDGNLTVTAGHEISHRVKDALLASPLGISNAWIHVEPARP